MALIPVKDEKSIKSFLKNIKNKKDVKKCCYRYEYAIQKTL